MSANSGDDIYNGVVVEGTAADGGKVSIRRTQAQQAGVALETLSTPAANNPSFAVDTSTWAPSSGTAITRDTTTFDSTPAAGRWDRGGGSLSIGDTLTETFTGTFLQGVTYVLTVRLRCSAGAIGLALKFGDGTANDLGTSSFLQVASGFSSRTLSWTPSRATASVSLQLAVATISAGTVFLHVDSLAVSAARPTLVDRRGFRRTQILPVQSSLDSALGNQIGDTWLAAHKTTPLKGSVQVTGDKSCREITTGASIPPERLLTMTGELLRLSHRVDPDTGGQGRDGRIAEVTYTPALDQATVAIDSTRTNVQALLARLAIVVGQGQ